jgi:hypothetical protein
VLGQFRRHYTTFISFILSIVRNSLEFHNSVTIYTAGQIHGSKTVED